MSRSRLIGATAMVSLAIAAGLWWGGRGPDHIPPSITASSGESVPLESVLTVHVAGWVRVPGLVIVKEGARVADAVAAAGGFLPGAAIGSVNLAAPVRDGDQILIGGPDQAASGASPPTTDGKVRLNQATAAELEALPGVGPVLAERIITYRTEHGPFQTIEDLLDVSGIGEAKLASLRDLLVVP